MNQKNKIVNWIVSNENKASSFNKMDVEGNNSITFDEFLQVDFSRFKIPSGVVIDLEYEGSDSDARKAIENFKSNFQIGKLSKIGQVLFALARYNDSDSFLKFAIEDPAVWPLGGQVNYVDASEYQTFLRYFLEYKKIKSLKNIKMNGYQSSKFDLNGNQANTVAERKRLSGVDMWIPEGDLMLRENSGQGDNDIPIIALNSILEGVAGCGKTYYQKSLFDENGGNKDLGFALERSETVVFHPSTSYEDFVSGLRPVKDGGFTGKAGIFVELCNRAAADPENKYLLFIDEINRANTAKVFGDLLMVIEESKRTPVANLEIYKRAVLTRSEAKSLGITSVRLQTAIDTLPEKAKLPVDSNTLPENANPPVENCEVYFEYLAVPDNLYIIGTMNSTDRSVGTIDLALRRRFTWHTMEPMTAKELRGKDKVKDRDDLNQLNPLLSWYDEANEKLYKKVGPDARLGHSYFFQDDKSVQQIVHDLLKQLAEIFYIFHLEDLLSEEPFSRPIQNLKLKSVGEGLGQKFIVEQVSANSSGKASGKPEPAEIESGEFPENPQES